MGLGWARYVAAPVSLLALGAAGAYVAVDQHALDGAAERAVTQEPQGYYEASFLDPTSMCDPRQRTAWVGVALESSGEPVEVVWRVTSDTAPDAVEFGSTVLRPGDEQRVYARMPIRRRGVTTIRFATADWDHELHYRCTPESSLGG